MDKEAPTGTCAVTILDAERSLTTRLGAANKYKLDHVKEPELLEAFSDFQFRVVHLDSISPISCMLYHDMNKDQ